MEGFMLDLPQIWKNELMNIIQEEQNQQKVSYLGM